jgi:hypothetical protein
MCCLSKEERKIGRKHKKRWEGREEGGKEGNTGRKSWKERKGGGEGDLLRLRVSPRKKT